MQALREAVKACQSGPALVAALEGAEGVSSGPIPGLIADCIAERTAAGSANGATKALAAAATGARTSLEDALCVIDGLMFLSPRGKQQLALFSDCMMVKTAKADIAVPWGAIQHVAIIDEIPGDTKNKVLIFLHIDSEAKVMNGKSVLTAVVVQTTAQAQLDVAHPQDPAGSRLQGAAPVVLCQALGAVPGGPGPACFVSPDTQYFRSADKAAGVKAHVKARDGFLYLLPSALCFLEVPQLFVPHSKIASVELMRAGGSSSTFDLVVHLRDGHAVEFGMIGRSELGSIEDYIRKCRLAVGAACSSDKEGVEEEGGSADAGTAQEEEEAADSDDPEDEDFNPTSSSSEDEEEAEDGGEAQQQQQKSGGSGGAKRKRSESGGVSAREQGAEGEGEAGSSGSEEDEEEEEDEDEEESSSEEEDSDSDGSVELVSEDDFSKEQLHSMIASEAGSKGSGGGGGGPRAKRQRAG